MLSTVRRLSAVAVVTFFLSSFVDAGLSGCPKNLAIQLTNIFQIGDIKFQYSNCELDNEGYGYASGIANFCTGTSDTWPVIMAYHYLTGGNDEFSKYDSVLAKRAEDKDGSVVGLEGFCEVWQNASTSKHFITAQDAVYDELYFNPSQIFADELGLKLSVSQAAMYDTAILRGAGDYVGTLGGIIKETNEKVTGNKQGDSKSSLKINGYTVDEIEWLNMFLDVRANYDNIGTTVNIKSYKYIIEQKEYAWKHNISILDNGGQPGNITCDNSYNSQSEQIAQPLVACGNACSEVESSKYKSFSSSASRINSYGPYVLALGGLAALFFY
ncbi:hypothetical protein LPJ66_007510 [Kickxella alabastrina]|uniref:Uncharacterized protein n=1 Tax=Kickxella alabastrina TaxID=61397 RepID=A0ACC1ICF2_9FUNG|nr:hypothetical protein LPJ66_007510 [Kickxella alabastrina]